MIDLILVILGVWFVALFAGPTIYAAMGLAGFAFLLIAGIPGIVIPHEHLAAAQQFLRVVQPFQHVLLLHRQFGDDAVEEQGCFVE